MLDTFPTDLLNIIFDFAFSKHLHEQMQRDDLRYILGLSTTNFDFWFSDS